MVPLMRSPRPFCSGVSAAVVSWKVPSRRNCSSNAFPVYSPPPSVRRQWSQLGEKKTCPTSLRKKALEVVTPLVIGSLGIRLLLDQAYPSKAGVAINESDPIAIAFTSGWSNGSTNIRVDNLQWTSGLVRFLRFEGQLVHLPHDTWFTELRFACE